MPLDFSDAELAAIPLILSQPRFARYLSEANGDARLALALYRWNAQVSAAFLFPLHLCEVTLRNAVCEVLQLTYKAEWPWQKQFEFSLPNPPSPRYSQLKDLRITRKKYEQGSDVGKIVAELKFAFWHNLFTARHDERLWSPHILEAFPTLPYRDAKKARGEIYDHIRDIRDLRNRVAHHEPIYRRNLPADYRRIKAVISWRSRDAASWMCRLQTVETLISQRPF